MENLVLSYRKLITSLRRIVPTNAVVENEKPYTIASEAVASEAVSTSEAVATSEAVSTSEAEASEAEVSESESSESESSESESSEPTWTEVLVGLAVPEYKWAADLINATMDSTIATVVDQTKDERTEAIVIINELEDLIEKVLVKLEDNIPTVQEEQSQAEQFLIIPLEEKKEEITTTTTTTTTGGGGWFSWLGWS